jgi:low temperature requirement protein LtrA
MIGLRQRMTARDTTEQHRTATPLELLFDLTFVVAISQVAAQLAHSTEKAHPLEALLPFVMVFFAIWWAWMNFTWFASAYATDDVLYRVLAFVQIAGVLVIAGGVREAFESGNFAVITVGYLVMRVGLIALWVRAAIEHPEGRATALRYAVGISIVQVLWVARLALVEQGTVWTFVAIAMLDLAVPLWAERTGSTNWHAHHIAERYQLFTIILLGESVFAATLAVQDSISESGVGPELITIAMLGLVIIFTLWWLYFSEPAGDGLSQRRERSFIWGYGHFGIFIALAAIGAGLEVAVVSVGHDIEAGATMVAYSVAIPTAVFLVLLWALHAPLVDEVVVEPAAIAVVVVGILVLPLAAESLGLIVTLGAVAALLAALLAFALARSNARSLSV